MLRYERVSRSAGNKKWISATAVADHGDAQALWIPGTNPGFTQGISVGACTLHNRSGGSVQCGLGARFPVGVWQAGTVTAAGVYTDATTAAQNATVSDFTLHSRADSGSGFILACNSPFNAIGIVQGVAGDQTNPVQKIEYWSGSGTPAWTDITAGALINDALDANSTGEKLIVIPEPSDWVTGGSGTGVPTGVYCLRITQTNAGAGTADPKASQVFIGQAMLLLEALADNGVSALVRGHELSFRGHADALFPIFSTASFASVAEIDVRAR